MPGSAREDRAAPRSELATGKAWPHRTPLVVILNGTQDAASPAGEWPAGSYDRVTMAVDRTTMERLVQVQPDVVVIHTAEAVDVVRLAKAIHSLVEGRIVIVAAEPVSDALVIRALDAGADDVVTGTSPAVLDARIRAALRARPPRPRLPSLLHAGDLTVDLNAHVVLLDGRPVRCPPVQYEVLLALVAEPGATIASHELLHRVWGVRPGDVHPRRLRIAISTLRALLGSGPHRPTIETVARVGYRLIAPAS